MKNSATVMSCTCYFSKLNEVIKNQSSYKSINQSINKSIERVDKLFLWSNVRWEIC